jgi:Lrp/AsnC family leucine-responsive transcriptional regulator
MRLFDDLDLRILEHIQQDGRITNQELADKIGLSPSPCLRRLRQLEAEGVVSRYVALINPQKLGLTVTAFVRVRLSRQDDKHLAMFEAKIAGFPEVMECYLMTGDCD